MMPWLRPCSGPLTERHTIRRAGRRVKRESAAWCSAWRRDDEADCKMQIENLHFAFCILQFFLFRIYRSLRHDKAIGAITNFAPRQLRQRVAGEERSLDGQKLNAEANGGPSFGQIARHEKLVIAKATVGRLHMVLRGAEFFLRVGVNTGIRTGKIPNAGALPLRIAILTLMAIGYENFGTLVGESVIEFAAQKNSK